VLAIVMLNVSSKALKLKPPSIVKRTQTKKTEKVFGNANEASDWIIIIKVAVNCKTNNKIGDKKHNKPTTTAAKKTIKIILPPPTPKSTKPVRFALNGKTPFASYDWGN
jgi:hypothetical protein